MTRSAFNLFDPDLLRPAALDAFRKLDPRVQWRNPVMFVVYAGSWLTTGLAIRAVAGVADVGSEGAGGGWASSCGAEGDDASMVTSIASFWAPLKS